MSLASFLTIVGAALVTFAIRAGGLLLAERLPSTGFVAIWLKHIPGAVMASLVGSAVVSGGPAEWIASFVVTATYFLTRNLLATIALGVVAVYIARRLFGA